MSAGVATRDRSAGAVFLAWLEQGWVQERGDGTGAFARWVVEEVAEGKVRAKDVRYPKVLERVAPQFGLEDWKDAWAAYQEAIGAGSPVYKTREIRYCSGDGQDEGEVGCWVDGKCVAGEVCRGD